MPAAVEQHRARTALPVVAPLLRRGDVRAARAAGRAAWSGCPPSTVVLLAVDRQPDGRLHPVRVPGGTGWMRTGVRDAARTVNPPGRPVGSTRAVASTHDAWRIGYRVAWPQLRVRTSPTSWRFSRNWMTSSCAGSAARSLPAAVHTHEPTGTGTRPRTAHDPLGVVRVGPRVPIPGRSVSGLATGNEPSRDPEPRPRSTRAAFSSSCPIRVRSGAAHDLSAKGPQDP